MIVLETQHGDAHVAAAVDDQGIGAVAGEAVDAADEDVLVLHVGIGTVSDAEAVVADLAEAAGRFFPEAAAQFEQLFLLGHLDLLAGGTRCCGGGWHGGLEVED